ncbi:hypothetical protein [Microbacterium sp. zg.Y909]|uniref:hypothetical protein n=1 Tax=Microbacterium sp. zg.Y909 TaxID=2969413 RepID=UPI00214B89A7|nr:hypothetical protein [Microbacterium sp. zg.Y909]MCR2824036.1 hypothetical protein [Microbacterium sp. zg.Y909]
MSRIVAIVSQPGAIAGLGDLVVEHEVVIVGPSGENTDHVLRPTPLPSILRRWVDAAWRSPAGRNAVRISPWDTSRRLWRAARRDRRLRSLIAGADVVIAVDRDAVFTVWKMSRKRDVGRAWTAVYGTNAARFALAR